MGWASTLCWASSPSSLARFLRRHSIHRMSEMSALRSPRSSAPASAPPDDDDLLSEIFLRLPPQPSALPRASFVCQRWRRIISDPAFIRRFRTHHRRNAPLLGCFIQHLTRISFHPALERPDRLHPRRFRLQLDDADGNMLVEFAKKKNMLVDCRHGLLLIFQVVLCKLLVWDPITGDQHRLDVPATFEIKCLTLSSGAVLRAAGDVHFQVVLAAINNYSEQARAVAWVYSSETGVWSNLISILLPTTNWPAIAMLLDSRPSVLVGNSFYWLIVGHLHRILEFDMDTQSLAVIPLPVDIRAFTFNRYRHHIIQADDGGLGMLSLSDFSAQLWKRETDCNGVASWVIGKTIELEKLLSLDPKVVRPPKIVGFVEDKNVVFLGTDIGTFMVQLESLQFKNLFESDVVNYWHPFESVYTETSIGGGHDGAELLHNT